VETSWKKFAHFFQHARSRSRFLCIVVAVAIVTEPRKTEDRGFESPPAVRGTSIGLMYFDTVIWVIKFEFCLMTAEEQSSF
jgi:hypothetical protein